LARAANIIGKIAADNERDCTGQFLHVDIVDPAFPKYDLTRRFGYGIASNFQPRAADGLCSSTTFADQADTNKTFNGANTMTSQFVDVLPGLPPISVLTVVAFGLMMGTMVLYMVSRIPELLLIAIVAFIYGVVPVISLIKHC
jgi:hypothetical protein